MDSSNNLFIIDSSGVLAWFIYDETTNSLDFVGQAIGLENPTDIKVDPGNINKPNWSFMEPISHSQPAFPYYYYYDKYSPR